MTRFTRLAFAAALAVGLVGSTARAADADKLLPPDVDTVAIVNVKQILGSEIVKKYALEQVKQALEGQDAQQVLKDMGLDPLKDIEKVVLGGIDVGQGELKYLVVVHGNFEPTKLFKAAEKATKTNADRFSMVKDGDVIMFKLQPRNDQQPPIYATVVDGKRVVAASEKKYISDALKAADSNKPVIFKKKEIGAMIKKADEKASVVAIGLVKGKFENVQLPGGGNLPVQLDKLQEALPNAESIMVTVKIGADVEVEATFGMKDAESANDMRNAVEDLLTQVKPLAQLAAAAEPRAAPLGDILASIKTNSKNKDCTISGKVKGDQIGQMVNPID